MADDNVVEFGGITKLPIPADCVLNAALGKLDDVVVIGHDKDGDFYFAGSSADGGDTLWLLERARHKLMQVTDDLEAGE